jgi:AcrR family transcriptional regulator
MPRAYDNTKRARAAARTTQRIVAATEALLADGPIGDVTLPAIAAAAEVTVQTVLRHMGSRDGCIAAVAERVGARIDAQRGGTEPGDVDAAIAALIAHYEAEGRLVLNLLAQEASGEAVPREAAEAGRAYHRAWVVRCFGPWPHAAGSDGDDPQAADPQEGDAQRIDALVAATDLYVWKLLRLDLGRSREATEAVVARLVRSVLEASWAPS